MSISYANNAHLTKGVTKPYFRIRLNRQVKYDLLVWRQFLISYNYKTFMLEFRWLSSPQLHLFTDAASTIGFGAVFGNRWFYGLWPSDCVGLNITLLELYPICLALYIWGPFLTNNCITLHSDNQAVVAILNSCTSKESNIMILVRKIVLNCMTNNILICSKHIPGTGNIIPDLLSRNQVLKAKQMAPWLDPQPTVVPPQWCLSKWLNA